MTTIIHCADLHLTAGDEREYSLSVFGEIIDLVKKKHADYLLICGDLFDSFDDAEELRGAVRSCVSDLPNSSKIIYIPGNHEELQKGGRSIESLDLGFVKLCSEIPCKILPAEEGLEFLCIPHQETYAGYLNWEVPVKSNDLRVALVHGLVSDMDIYAGPESEEEGIIGAVDPDIFHRFEVDYAALGHIHSRHEKIFDDIPCHYPGSARTWRRGELGEHGINIVTLDNEITVDFVPLRSAGQYREYDIPLTFDGNCGEIDAIKREWTEYDWIVLNLGGVVEDENAVGEFEDHLHRTLACVVRRLDIRRDGVQPLPGISSQPIAKKFLELLESRKPGEGDIESLRTWARAREMGLEQIADILRGGG